MRRGMKCPICGKQTLPGAKLCAPCRAALKRARDDSAWQLPERATSPRADPSSVAIPASRWVLGSGRLPAWRGATIAALLVALGVAGGTLITRSGEAAKAPQASAARPTPIPVAQPAVQQPAPAQPEAASEAPPPRRAPAHDDVMPPPRHQPPVKPSRVAPEPAPALALVPVPVEPPPVVEPPKPAPAREPPGVSEPGQAVIEALARCAAEDFFGRIRCEYRVRASFCEGRWGEVPQCPGAPVNDHGQ